MGGFHIDDARAVHGRQSLLFIRCRDKLVRREQAPRLCACPAIRRQLGMPRSARGVHDFIDAEDVADAQSRIERPGKSRIDQQARPRNRSQQPVKGGFDGPPADASFEKEKRLPRAHRQRYIARSRPETPQRLMGTAEVHALTPQCEERTGQIWSERDHESCHMSIFRPSPNLLSTPSAADISNPQCIMQWSQRRSRPGPKSSHSVLSISSWNVA
jgi:hypothetical protein